MAKKKVYDNDSISSLKGADRVRKRPGVIFGSDGLEGCEHAVFEIMSNAIDEARAGFGRLITVTRFLDKSIQVEDQGRGCPVDWNEKEGRYNWELVFCEMYAGGKYDPTGENYEFSLGLNGLGSCATQYASRYMDVTVCRDGNEYKLHFRRGEIAGQMEVTPLTRRKTGTTIRWLPDLEVFTDIDIPLDYYRDVMKRQAVVNAGVTFRLRSEVSAGRFDTQDFLYENGIRDYIAELAGEDPITEPVCWEAERQGRDRADKPEYKVKLNIAWCFSNRVHLMEHYHNSSFLEHGGSPDKATRLAFVAALDKYLRDNNKYTKGESKITFPWSMIDKITPRPHKMVEESLEKDGIEGMTPIVTSKNTFIAAFVNAERPQYLVVEDKFPNGRPALEKAGVYMTDRETVNKTERMKVTTCLNPLHTAMSVYGCMLGYDLICAEMKDEDIVALIKRLGYVEGLPVVVDPKILAPKAFIDEVIEQRLPNPFMPDTPQRIATDTSQKVGIRFGETIKSYIAEGRDLNSLVSIPLAIAGWLRYLLAIDDNGNAFEVSADPLKDDLQAKLAGIEFGKPETVTDQLDGILSNASIFGSDLTKTVLADKIKAYFKAEIAGAGAVRKTLHEAVNG